VRLHWAHFLRDLPVFQVSPSAHPGVGLKDLLPLAFKSLLRTLECFLLIWHNVICKIPSSRLIDFIPYQLAFSSSFFFSKRSWHFFWSFFRFFSYFNWESLSFWSFLLQELNGFGFLLLERQYESRILSAIALPFRFCFCLIQVDQVFSTWVVNWTLWSLEVWKFGVGLKLLWAFPSSSSCQTIHFQNLWRSLFTLIVPDLDPITLTKITSALSPGLFLDVFSVSLNRP